MPASPARKPKNAKRLFAGVASSLLVIVLSLGVFTVSHYRPLSPEQKAIQYAKQLAPAGSIISIDSVYDIKNQKKVDYQSFSAILKVDANRQKLSQNPSCLGVVKVNYYIEVGESPLSPWDTVQMFFKTGRLGTKVTMTINAYWVDAEAMYKTLATGPDKALPVNLDFDHKHIGQDYSVLGVHASNKNIAFACLDISLADLTECKLDDAAYSCLAAAKSATLSGAAHDEYEHVRQLVIAKLPPNSPEIPPSLDKYANYRKKLQNSPLTPGSAP